MSLLEVTLKIISKSFDEWDSGVKKQLLGATFTNGIMRYGIITVPNSKTYVAFADEGDNVLGWVMLVQFPYKTGINAFIFVNKQYRKNGIANKLLNKVLENHPKVILVNWNRVTNRLFNRLQRENPDKVIVLKWSLNLGRAHLDMLYKMSHRRINRLN